MEDRGWTITQGPLIGKGPSFYPPSSILHPRCSDRHPRPAFTLVEMLTVIVIIVLIIGLALPVFRSLNGSRSEEGASNQIAGMLGRARAEAIGVQLPRGVAFYVDQNSGQTAMALVQPESTSGLATWTSGSTYSKWTYVQYALTGQIYVANRDVPSGTTTNPSTDTTHTYWYPADQYVVDEVADTNAELLPIGVGAQLVNDWGLASNQGGAAKKAPASDSYVSTGVIMFDGQGRLTSTPVSITQQGILGSAMGMAATGSFNYPQWKGTSGNNGTTPPVSPAPLYPFSGTSPNYIVYGTLYSAFGLVVYDRDAFTAQNFDTIDPTYAPATSPKSGSYTAGTPSEQTEEQWLDQNGTPLLINRFNGTLIRGQ